MTDSIDPAGADRHEAGLVPCISGGADEQIGTAESDGGPGRPSEDGSEGQASPRQDDAGTGRGGRRRKGDDGLLVMVLGAGGSLVDAASAAGMSVRTAQRRYTDPEILGRIDAYRSDRLEMAAARLVGSLDASVSTLVGLLSSDSEQIRLRTACAVIDRAIPLRRLDNEDRRFTFIEQVQAENAEQANKEPKW